MDIDISVIILSYNTKEMTISCVRSVASTLSKQGISSEVIVVDNGSSDDSADELHTIANQYSGITIHVHRNDHNVGFTKGNNLGASLAKGKYLLFLNSDTEITRIDFHKIIEYLDTHTQAGAYTVAVRLSNGKLDLACHRGFPNPWRAFCYLIGFEKIFATVPFFNKIFCGYHLLSRNMKTMHEIDSPTGAFFLIPKTLFESVRGFDEDFFMYGEDIDLAYRIKQKGNSVIFDPSYEIIHHKGKSGMKTNNEETQSKTRHYFYESMRIFLRKHYVAIYPKWLIQLMLFAIDRKERT